VSDPTTSETEINAGFDSMERTIKRESLFVPVVVTVGYGASMALVAWDGITNSGWGVISHLITLAFVIAMAWFYWDVDAKRRTNALKFQTAAGLLDHLVKEYDWKWEECEEAGSVSLHAPDAHEDDEEDADK
jgi:hypothetical protein